MIGIFDSGRGGVAVARELLSLCPECDVLLLADRKNLPYGTKSDRELIPIVKENLKRLCSFGADAMLIGCCTASSIYTRYLEPSLRVIPIIDPTARRAAEVTDGKICVIATRSTVLSHAFKNALEPVKRTGADTLVLGCTHFPLISEYISGFLPGVRIVNCVKEGALAALFYARAETGRIIYTE